MSWQPINLLDVEGSGPPVPSISGVGYPGSLTIVYGEPETLKSWLEAVVCMDAIRAGANVIWADFEMNAQTVVGRLRALGASDADLERFFYLQPSESLSDPVVRAGVERLVADVRPAVVVVDAMAGVLALHGLSANDADDVERLYGVLLRPFRASGAAVRLIDHVVKDRETQGRWPTGSQRKLGGADVGLKLELVHPFGHGATGRVRVKVTKDRPGGLARPYVAELTLSSDSATGAITARLAPAGSTDQPDEGGQWMPTWYMEAVSRVLEASGPQKRGDLVKAVGRKRERVLDAINHLIVGGYISETIGARGAKVCTLIQPFRERSENGTEHGTTEGNGSSRSPFPTTNGNGSGNGSRERLDTPLSLIFEAAP